MQKARHVVSSVTGVSFLSALGRIPGLLIPFYVAVEVGVTAETDAFFFALTLAMFVTTIFTSASETVVVPFLREGGDAQVRARVGAVIRGASPVLAVVVLLLVIAAGSVITEGTALPESVRGSGTRMLQWLALLVGLAAVTSVYNGALNAQRSFLLPAISPALRTGCALVVGLVFLAKDGLIVLVVGLVVGEAVRLSVVALWARRRMPKGADVGTTAPVGPFFRQASWQVLAMVVLSANPVINRIAATFLAPGSVSLLEYAEKLWFIPVTFLTAGLGPVLLTNWVDVRREDDQVDLVTQVRKATLVTLAVSGGIAVVAGLLSPVIVRLALGYGEFPAGALDLVRTLFMLYLLSLPAYVANTVIAQAHIATLNTRALLNAAVIRTTTHLVSLWLFFGPLQLLAVPVAQAAATSVSATYLWLSLSSHRRQPAW